jgi:copper chaperone CopZ
MTLRPLFHQYIYIVSAECKSGFFKNSVNKMEKTLKISGMHCGSCEKIVGMAVEAAGAKLKSVDAKSGVAVVQYSKDAQLAHAVEEIKKEGYGVS